MSAKSKAALCMTVSGIRDPYLWTFTLPVYVEPRKAARMWSLLQRDLVRNLGMWGVRVFELHPGGHGLHVHVVAGRFHRVEPVRALCERYGWGRVNVKHIPSTAAGYVAKYVSKSERSTELKGMRLWAVMGKGICEDFKPSKVKDIESDSPVHRQYRRLREICPPSCFAQHRKLWRLAQMVVWGFVRVTVEESPGVYMSTRTIRDGVEVDSYLHLGEARPRLLVRNVFGKERYH
jgi:hypothetical protein